MRASHHLNRGLVSSDKSSHVQLGERHVFQLATEGMRFTRCYQAAPMCSPTRHNICTGLYPVKSGAYPNHAFAKEGAKIIVHYLKPRGYRWRQKWQWQQQAGSMNTGCSWPASDSDTFSCTIRRRMVLCFVGNRHEGSPRPRTNHLGLAVASSLYLSSAMVFTLSTCNFSFHPEKEIGLSDLRLLLAKSFGSTKSCRNQSGVTSVG